MLTQAADGARSLAVPLHLREAPYARMKQHGIGVGYRYSTTSKAQTSS